MRKLLFIFTLLLGTVSTAFAQPLLTLEEAVAIGLKQNYNIRIARNDSRIAQNNKGLGTAAFLPTITASGGYMIDDNKQELNLPESEINSDIDQLSADITLSWTIFDGFNMFATKGRYNELAKLSEYQSKNLIENTVLSITEAYYNLVLQQQLYDILKETRDVSKIRLDREEVRKDLGGASSADYLNAQVSYNTDETNLLEQELNLIVARERLNVLLAQEPTTEFKVDTEIPLRELQYNYSEILEMSLKENSTLKVAEYGKAAADKSVSSARSAFLPRVSLFASMGYTDNTRNSDGGVYPDTDVITKNTDASVGVNLSFNIFNGRSDYINLKNAQIEAKNQKLALEDARNQLTGLVQETFDTYEQRMKVVTLEEKNIEAAESNLRIQQERFELGASNSLEYRDAQISLNRSKTSLITAKFQARIAHLEIEKLIGKIAIE